MSGRFMSPAERTRMMRSIRSENTKPEMIVRKILWGLGGRYRLHQADLPGRPDIVMRSRRLAILVHGCLWHLHQDCKLARVPKSRPEYWFAKLQGNKERDVRNLNALRHLGWTPEVIWECETRDPQRLRNRIRQILERCTRKSEVTPPQRTRPLAD